MLERSPMDEKKLTEMFQWLHRHPELSGREYETTAFLKSRLPARRGRIKTLCIYDTISARFEEAALRSAYVGACFPMIFPEPRLHPSEAAAPGCGDPGPTGFRP